MAAEKLYKLVALTSLALLALSFGPTQVNALASNHHLNRHVAHDVMAKRKRDASTKRCKPRSTTSLTTSTAAATSTTQAATTTTEKAKAAATSAAATVPAVSSGGGGNGFILIAGGPDDPSTVMGYDSVVALYNWAPTFWGMSKLNGKPFWPMYWGSRDQGDIQGLPNASPTMNFMFGQNEIDQGGQANQSPQTACDQYRQFVAPYAGKGYTLVSPSTSSAPTQDLQDWFKICGNDLGVKHAQAHWYDTCPDKLISWVENIHQTTGANIYLTEYAVANFRGSGFHGGADPSTDPNYVIQFHANTYPRLKALGYVEVISPFGFFSDAMPGGVHDNNRLITQGTSNPNNLGKMFLTGSFPAPQANYPFWCD